MPSRRQAIKKWASVLLLLAAAMPLWACGGHDITMTVQGNTAVATVVIEGKLQTFTGVVGSDGCVEWNIDGCQGRQCGLWVPGVQYKITCNDPLLAEWPDAWTLMSATWSAPDLGLDGDILVTPASNWVLSSEFGAIVTDPGNSAWVMKLDYPGDLGPTVFVLELVFDLGTPPVEGCVKGIDIATIERLDGASPPVIYPTDPTMGVDFTVFHEGDPNVFCVDLPTPVEGSTGGRLKSVFR